MSCFYIVLKNQIENVTKKKSYYVSKCKTWVPKGYLTATESIELLELIEEKYPDEEPHMDKAYYFDRIAEWSTGGYVLEGEAVELITYLEEKYPDEETVEQSTEVSE